MRPEGRQEPDSTDWETMEEVFLYPQNSGSYGKVLLGLSNFIRFEGKKKSLYRKPSVKDKEIRMSAGSIVRRLPN